jgi:hypothetical protein
MRSQKPKHSPKTPRRKAGSKVHKKADAKLTFRLRIEAQEMAVTYEPNWLEGANAHFEFMSPFDPPRRIILSETGYHSHFAPMEAVATFKLPEDYARVFVVSILESSRKAVRGQLSLF